MKNIYKALANFQQECPIIHKDTQGFNYTYADLPAIFKVINPLLKKHGLGFTQLVEEQSIKTVLFHIESAEAIETNTSLIQGVSLNKMNTFQILGSQITYLRRYALSSMLGVVTDKDTDASGTQATTKAEKELNWLNLDKVDVAVKYAKDNFLKADDLRKFYKIRKEIMLILNEKIK